MHAIEELRRLGFRVEAVGDNVRVRHPAPSPPTEGIPLLKFLRQHKSEVLAELTASGIHGRVISADEEDQEAIIERVAAEAPSLPPELPKGLRLIAYAPKKPPVALESWSVVTDVEKFIRSTVADLDARLNNPGSPDTFDG